MGPVTASLDTLVGRFDPTSMDVPRGSARIRLEVVDEGAWDAVITGDEIRLVGANGREPDALLTGNAAAWAGVASDSRRGGLQIRRNLHLGVGFLAATSGSTDPARLRFHSVTTRTGKISVAEAGSGEPLVALHGLGATKASFLPTLGALAGSHRVIAVDLPGFGESDKPIGAPYDAPWFARRVVDVLDALELDRAHLAGNSMGGRIALETGMTAADRVGGIVLLCPAVAWLGNRSFAPLLRFLRPELGLLQPTPRPVVEALMRRLVPGGAEGWAAAGVDEFLRSFLTRAAGRPSTPRPATSTSTSRAATAGSGSGSSGSSRRRSSSGAATTASCPRASAVTSAGAAARRAARARLRPRAAAGGAGQDARSNAGVPRAAVGRDTRREMSQANVEIVRAVVRRLEAGDYRGALSELRPGRAVV